MIFVVFGVLLTGLALLVSRLKRERGGVLVWFLLSLAGASFVVAIVQGVR